MKAGTGPSMCLECNYCIISQVHVDLEVGGSLNDALDVFFRGFDFIDIQTFMAMHIL